MPHATVKHSGISVPVMALLAVLGVSLLAVAGIVIAGFFPWSLDRYRPAIREKLASATGSACDVGSLSIVPWRSIVAGEVRLNTKAAGGTAVRVEVGRLSVDYDVWKALADRSTRSFVRRALVRRMRSDEAAAVLGALVKRVRIDDAAVAVEAQGREIMSAEKVRFDGNVGPDMSVDGTVTVDRLMYDGTWRADHIHGEIGYAKGLVSVGRLTGRAYGGTFSVRGRMDPARRVLDTCFITAGGIDIAALYAAYAAREGTITGTAAADLTLGPCPLAADGIRGAGRVRCTRMTVVELPLQRSLAIVLGFPGLKQLGFEEVGARLRLRGGMLYNDSLAGTGSPMDLKAAGWIRLDDAGLSQKIRGTFTREFCAVLPPLVANTLLPEPDGRKSFAGTVTGTFQQPRVSLERALVQRAVQNLWEELKKSYFK